MLLQSEQFLTKYVANTFKVVIQLGSILAVVVVFKDRFIDLLGLERWIKRKNGKVNVSVNQSRQKLSQVIVGLIPAGVLGLVFKYLIDDYLFSQETVVNWILLCVIFMSMV